MKKHIALLLAAAMAASLSACDSGDGSADSTADSSDSVAVESSASVESEESAPEQYEITLCADFSAGSERAEELDLIKTTTALVDEPTPEAIAAALSEWTGLDFFLEGATVDGATIVVDWSADSTLIAGIGDREFKEDFFFYDVESLNWFMMDSLYSSIIESIGVCDVYYTMDGGQELRFAELYPVNVFPSDTPYLGSPFYFAHADNVGDTGDADYSRTAGMWRLDGEEGTASIYMDGAGGFVAYYASGAVEAEGYLSYADEYSDGNGRYDMYDYSGSFINGFYFDSDDTIHMGNNGAMIYIRTEGGDDTASAGVLVYSPGFTGITPVTTDNDFYGGHFYEDITADGDAAIINACFENDYPAADGETLDDYFARWAEILCTAAPEGLSCTRAAFGSYEAYRVSWAIADDGGEKSCDALAVLTDDYTYIYAFETSADLADEMSDLREDTFAALELIFPE